MEEQRIGADNAAQSQRDAAVPAAPTQRGAAVPLPPVRVAHDDAEFFVEALLHEGVAGGVVDRLRPRTSQHVEAPTRHTREDLRQRARQTQ